MLNIIKDFWFLFGRLFPFPTKPGLRQVGSPDKNSPVLITANFELTVRQVINTLNKDGINAWLLVANTRGINVWCAAGGDNFSTDTVISALKSSKIEEMVDHKRLILPQLCASGVNIHSLKKRSGWQGRFGPVDIKHLAAWLQSGRPNPPAEHRRVLFPFKNRLVMGTNLGVNTLLFAILPLLLASYWLPGFWWKSLLLIFAAAILNCLLVFKLPGKPGLQKGLALGGIAAAIFTVIAVSALHLPFINLSGWLIWIIVIGAYLGYDTPSWSPLWRTDMKELLLGERNTEVSVSPEKCIGCGLCQNVCPAGVFGRDLLSGKSTALHLERCQACGACVENCPAAAIETNFEGGICSCPTCQILNKLK
ncbi:MAG: 4Fe-4S dicluster domain-containing protein [Deltaproteobacteria bacterium]|nr:4Fe-4S dicluster domain-containing protein [Deltaproteobacteria bacterium]